jgi:uncharacterized repeat protein (TIGR01451 family)
MKISVSSSKITGSLTIGLFILVAVGALLAFTEARLVSAQQPTTSDLGVTKTGPDQVAAGANITYTITVTNFGPDPSSNATLNDPLPGTTTFVSLSNPAGWNCTTPSMGANGTANCTNTNLAVNSDQVFTLVVNVPANTTPGTFITNIATVSDPTDPNSENDSSAAATMVSGGTSADLGVTKSASASQSFADKDVTYTITVNNAGPNAATNAVLTDPLPQGFPSSPMTFVSLPNPPVGWSCTTPTMGTNGTITCTKTSLAVNSPQVFTLVGHIPPGTSVGTEYDNKATVSSDTSDPNSENNSATAVTTVVTCLTNPVVTTNADSGAGSLRQAILDACDGATITFDMTQFTSPITLSSAELLINKNLTINGPGASLLTVMRSAAGGTPNFRIFEIANAAITVNISGLTISNGRTADGASGMPGDNAGGILNNTNATLNIKGVTVSNNLTGSGGSGAPAGNAGGGIYNFGILTLTNSTVSGNKTGGGMVGGAGGGIFNNGTATLTNCTISGNQTDNSGGGGNGAGIANSGTLTLADCTISNNQSIGIGGGVFNPSAVVNIRNTVIANNTASFGPDLSGTFNSQDYNLIGNTSGATFTGTTTHNIVNTSAKLGALGNNGGPTQTMLPLPGSPAIDAGDPANLPPDTFDLNNNGDTTEPLPVDQRGFPRVINNKFDIGAVEVNYSISATAGTPQSATINTAFATALKATVTESGNAQNGIAVTFTAPNSGASGTFPGSSLTAMVNTNASGIATAPTFTANGTAGGPYNVIASIGAGLPTANFALTNTQAATSTAVSSSINPSNLAQSVTFTATVTSASGTPTGTVQFKDGANVIACSNAGGQTLNASGVATCQTSSLTAGNHMITAVYSGDANFLTSTGTLSGGQTVNNRPLVSFSASNYNVNESDGVAHVIINRTGDTTVAFNVDYATDDTGASTDCSKLNTGLASSRCDYTTMLGTLKFAANQTQATLDIPINQDGYMEGPESFTVNLSNPTGTAGLVVPSSAMVTINDSVPPAPNVIDDTTVFVRQHYHDFLSREPDAAGLAFWKNNIDKCNDPAQRQPGQTLAQCIEVQRINTSVSFFLSIEFMTTGTFVRNFYVAALDRPATGNMPAFNEWLRDTQAVQRGVIVGQAGWPTVLSNNRTAFMNDFVMRAEFVGLYPTTDTPTQYVDKLYLHAGVTPSASERSAAIAEFGGAPTAADPGARGRALLDVTQNAAFQAREMNRAFVQIEYFGYLRRNPNDPPDGNFNGYNFWLNKLNLFNGNYIDAEMVKAFISSAEYRRRFGP